MVSVAFFVCVGCFVLPFEILSHLLALAMVIHGIFQLVKPVSALEKNKRNENERTRIRRIMREKRMKKKN